MSRMILTALAVFLTSASTASAQSVWQHPAGEQPIRFVSWDSAEAENPTYDELLKQLEETKAELGRTEERLNTAYEMADRYGTEEEIQEFREATSFYLNDYDLQDLNHSPEGSAGGPGGDMGDMATQSNNPVGGLWMLWFQNDMKLYEGPLGGKRVFNTTVFQPVMPVQLNDTWKVINRPVFMLNSFAVPDPFNFRPGGSQDPVTPPTAPFNTRAGIGDTAFIQWLSNSPSSSKMVTGVGWNWMFPTATHSDLGTGRTSLGPSAVAMYLGDKVITGAIMQQYWSIDSRDSRTRVSLMDLQYVFRYRLNPMFSVGMAPNIQWDQVTGKVTMPIGFGFDTMTFAGCGMPMRWGAEIQYFASHTGGPSRAFDPEWNFRMYVSPIIRAPEWAKRGLFGGCGRRCR